MPTQAQLTYIETDIDCLQCLDDVRMSLAATPWVDEVEIDASAGCLVVRHHGEEDELSGMVGHVGHRLFTGSNGEVMMDTPSVGLPRVCPVGQHLPGGDPR